MSVPYLDEHPAARGMLAAASLLYTDLDGTLVARGGGVLADASGAPSTVVAEAIVALNRAGMAVVPVSGRERSQLFELCRLLGWNSYIAEAGGVIVHGLMPHETITYNNGEWPASSIAGGDTPFRIIERSGAYEALVAAFPGRIEQYSKSDMARESTHLLRGCVDAAKAQAVLDALDPPIDFLDNGVVRTTPTLACDGYPAHAYHLVPRGVSKIQALRLDLELRTMTGTDALAIGDSVTDIAMADAVSLLALVDNAFESPAVIAELERHTPANLVRLRGARGEGWAEFASAWLEARS